MGGIYGRLMDDFATAIFCLGHSDNTEASDWFPVQFSFLLAGRVKFKSTVMDRKCLKDTLLTV